MKRLFTQFSFLGGIPSHVGPRRQAQSTKAASSATRFRMRMARLSTIRT